ncbi:hypothetical protein D3C71_2076790 [compost metagenome]
MHRPNMKARPMPTRCGWCTLQKASSSIIRSGSQTTRPSGSILMASAAIRLAPMNTGLTGSNSG